MRASRASLFATIVLLVGLLHAWAAHIAWIQRDMSVRHYTKGGSELLLLPLYQIVATIVGLGIT